MMRLGVTTSLNAYDLTALRFGIAAILLLPVVYQRRKSLLSLKIHNIVLLLFTFGAPYVLLIAWAMQTAPARAAGALNPGTMAIASVLLGHLCFGDRLAHPRLLGLGLTATGLILFIWAGGDFVVGHIILFATGCMWACYVQLIRRSGLTALDATALVAFGSAVFYVPVYIFFLPKEICSAPLSDIAAQALFQGVLVSVVAIYAFNKSADLLGSVASATLPATIPLVTLFLGVIILGEDTATGDILAASVVTSGLFFILGGAYFWKLLNGLHARPRSALVKRLKNKM